MIEIIRRHKIAVVLLVVSAAVAVGVSAWFFSDGGYNLRLFLLMAASWLWFFFQFSVFAKLLAKYGWKNPIIVQIRRSLLSLIGKMFEFLEEKFGILVARVKLPQWNKNSRLTHFQDERIRIFSEKKRNNFRKMKWKTLQNHRERVRFIYVSFLERKIKKGAVVLVSETPSELAVKFNDGDELTAKLFSLYNTARYAGDETIVAESDIVEILPCAARRLKL